MLTPAMVHYESADKVLAKRQKVLDAAYGTHPERFVSKPPTPPRQPTAVWINSPLTADEPRDANQPLIETLGQEDVTDEENDLEISPLTDSCATPFLAHGPSHQRPQVTCHEVRNQLAMVLKLNCFEPCFGGSADVLWSVVDKENPCRVQARQTNRLSVDFEFWLEKLQFEAERGHFERLRQLREGIFDERPMRIVRVGK